MPLAKVEDYDAELLLLGRIDRSKALQCLVGLQPRKNLVDILALEHPGQARVPAHVAHPPYDAIRAVDELD